MYDEETLAAKLKLLPTIQQWCKRLEEFAHAEATRGRVPPGFKLVPKRAIRRWKNENAAVTYLDFLGLDKDDILETSLRSPAQIEKLLPRKERHVLETIVEAHYSGTVLAPVDDPRPAVDPSSGFEAVDVAQPQSIGSDVGN